MDFHYPVPARPTNIFAREPCSPGSTRSESDRAIRAEVGQMLAGGPSGLRPYVEHGAGHAGATCGAISTFAAVERVSFVARRRRSTRPARALPRNRRRDRNAAAGSDISGRVPTVFFSMLQGR